MDELYDADICISNTDKGPVIEAQKAIVIDLSDQVSPLTPAYLDEVRASSKGLHESVIRASEFIQPTLPSGLCSANAASLIGGISGIAEAVKPLSVMKAVEGITTVSDMLPDLVASMPTLTDVLTNHSDTAAGIGGLTDQLIASLPEPPALAANFGTAVKVAIPEPKPFIASMPVAEAIGEIQGVSSLAEEMGQILSDNAQFAEEVLSVTRAASDAVKAIVSEVSDILAPIRDTLAKISEAIKPAFDFGKMISGLFVPIEIPTFCSGILSRIHEDAVGFSEFISSRWQEVVTGIKGLAHWMLLRIMRRRQRKEPQRLQLPWRGSLIEAASKAKIESSRSAPLQLREFIVPLRHALLHKYQRISDNSDDMDDVVFLPYAA